MQARAPEILYSEHHCVLECYEDDYDDSDDDLNSSTADSDDEQDTSTV